CRACSFFRTPVQRRHRPQVQACSGGIPPRDGTLECSTIGNLSCCCAHMGHHRCTECRFLCRTDDKNGKCSVASSWTSAASGCSSRPGADGDADDWVVALITVWP